MPCDHPPPEHVTVRSETGTWITFSNPVDPHGDGSREICVDLGYDSNVETLHCTAHGVTVGVMEPDPLSRFLQTLVDDFAGWPGPRTWQTYDDNLVVTATHTGHHVTLTWTLRTWHHRPTPWEATVTIDVEAGEQLRTFTQDLHHLLTHPAVP
ncbi:hypothetical protein DFJ66_3356 [Saccharothrix variisporea]|uniref:Uncharacterized protein n=2 Tax=Saccharothrix variisporea TaxID=543527 RepID=A0A495XBZ5_9PSEU|nr:hypothetical protein DFJ66_3356 [Saccharothrix variisporea]